ncbi:MAG: DUF6543 domain-containing protein [Pseudomonas prosekii]
MSSQLPAASSLTTDSQVAAAMTPEQQGIFYNLFKSHPIAPWLAQSTPEARTALHASVVASQRSRATVVAAMAPLKNPQQFCAPLLSDALADKLGEFLDIRGVVFQHIRSTSSLFGLRKKLVLPIDRDLLAAACENFEASETLMGNYDDKSLIYQPERINGVANKILNIKPHEFAQLCRSLDLGKQYQKHLDSVFEPNDETGAVRQACIAHSQQCFDVDRHMALMKKHISEPVFRMLADVASNKPSITLAGRAVACKGLELAGHALLGAMLIVSVSAGAFVDNPCVLYLPGDTQPLKEYPSVKALQFDLAARLAKPAFSEFLPRFVSLGNRADFQTALAARLLMPAPGWMQPSATAWIPVTTQDVTTDLFAELYRQRVVQIIADARLLVVPTDDEDEKSRLARIETYKVIGIDLILFGVSFIPVVGEVLMALTAAELVLGIYHGIESWSAGEQEAAADYCFDTLENLIVMVALSAGAGALRASFKSVRSTDFIQSLREVRLSDGKVRLWKPDLAPYRLDMSLPAWIKPDRRGLYWFEDQAYLTLGKDVYAVRQQADSDLWEIEGSILRESYSPRLETNDVGAWRHDSELPGEWDRLKLFRRLGYAERDIPDVRALQILAVSGTDERAMRRVLLDRVNPPALLVDTVRRFAADQTVLSFIEQLKDTRLASSADADLQLRLVTTFKQWPAETAINVVDSAGQVFSRYLAPDADSASKTLTLDLDKVRKGQFHADLLGGLSVLERERVLGSSTKVPSEQLSALMGKLAERADHKRLALFDWWYQRGVAVNEVMAVPLRRQFPDLPISIVDELINYAYASELEQLEAGSVPLRLAEEARRYAQVVRISRAYEGLYLDAAGGIDTDRVVLSTLGQLPGWESDLYVSVLEWLFYTDELASLGSEQATQQVRINAHPDRYEVRDAQSNLLSYLPGRTRAHYFQALWEGLSASRRAALGVEAPDAGVALRGKITALALARRAAAQRVLGIEAPRLDYASPMRLADSMPAPGIGGVQPFPASTPRRSAALIRRAQELYPAHSVEEINAFLAGLGVDDVLALRKLEGLRLEFLMIRQSLHSWINRESWAQIAPGPRLKVSTRAKSRAAQEIIRAWRRETQSMLTFDGRLYELTLAPLPLGDLPLLVGDFNHIGTLVMDRIGASTGLNTFLHNFKFLRRLSLVGNGLTRLAQAIGAMFRLEILDLSDNQIVLTNVSANELSGLTLLRQLNLSGNPTLSRTPDVAQLQLLERLELRGTGITGWPNGATGLMRLNTLDLRDNRITSIPEDVFAARLALNEGTLVAGNPLTTLTRQRLLAYQQLNDVSFGLSSMGYGHTVEDALLDATMSSTWLTGATEIEILQKRTLWSSVFAYPDSRPFFRLLVKLRYSADFRAVYRSLSQRVWEVVEAAAEDSELRRTLFRMANIEQISADGSSLLFSDLHVRVLCYRAMNVARGALIDTEPALTQLLRGLYRLSEVEKFALKNVISRTRTGPLSLDQAMEISLAYRVGLAERLNLPAQPRDMNFRLRVEVIPQTLDWIFAEVVKLEQTSALSDWMVLQEFWIEYLQSAHHELFDSVMNRAVTSFSQLDVQVHFTLTQFNQSMVAIVNNYTNDRRALIKRLTDEALQRNPGLVLPVTTEQVGKSPTHSGG